MNASGASVRTRHLAAVLVMAAAVPACAKRRSVAAGQRLFHGEAPLTARLAGDDMALPPEAIRCTNCHLRAPAPQAAAAAAGTQTFGPALVADDLRTERRRRGGPSSRYTLESFCATLRTGVDPAHVLLDRSMPRYELDATTCRALWDYLTEAQ